MPLGHNTVVVTLGLALLGASAGAVGCFALARRSVLAADAIGHATLPGVCAAFLLGHALGFDGRALPWLLLGGGASALLGVLALQLLVTRTRTTADAAVGAVVGSFFGLGIVLLGVAQRAAGTEPAGLDRLIFGQAATLGRTEAWLLLGLALGCGAALLSVRRLLTVTAFSPELARTAGFSPAKASAALLLLLGCVTLAGLPTVGMLLVIGLLVLPAAGARLWVERWPAWVALSTVSGALCATLGAVWSRWAERTPTGPAVILCCGAFLFLGLILSPHRGVLAVQRRRSRLRRELRA